MSDIKRAKELATIVKQRYRMSVIINDSLQAEVYDLARALLAVLPVVEAAEAWSKRTGGCGSRGCACPQGDLWRAVDALRKEQP